MSITLRAARPSDVPVILGFIEGLAEYEKLSHVCVATEAGLTETLFGSRPYAEVILAFWNESPAGFALFFHNYSTFLAKPGIYLEERNCGRLEWSVLDWNQPSIDFYLSLGAVAMDEWTIYRVTGDALKKLALVSPREP
jgi:hypothetical protein